MNKYYPFFSFLLGLFGLLRYVFIVVPVITFYDCSYLTSPTISFREMYSKIERYELCVAICCKFSPKRMIHMTKRNFFSLPTKTLLYLVSFFFLPKIECPISYTYQSVSHSNMRIWIYISDHTQYNNAQCSMKAMTWNLFRSTWNQSFSFTIWLNSSSFLIHRKYILQQNFQFDIQNEPFQVLLFWIPARCVEFVVSLYAWIKQQMFIWQMSNVWKDDIWKETEREREKWLRQGQNDYWAGWRSAAIFDKVESKQNKRQNILNVMRKWCWIRHDISISC